jgi:trehalose 6-phosphate phosphatase
MKEIIQRIKPGSRILLFLDYDGTLVPIKKAPELAVLHPLRRQFLKRLGEEVFMFIVSGRSLGEIRRLVAIKGIAYIGNHGLEISCGKKVWVHPEAKKIKPILRNSLNRIQEMTRDLPGVLIENKGLTGSIHYRRLPAAFWKPLKTIIQAEVGSRGRALKITKGKRVFEFRPNLDWNKGKGIIELLNRLDLDERPLCIYIGDDRTDEDAFRTLAKDDVTIRVGRRKDSRARYRLADVNHVWRFLKDLFERVSAPETTTFAKQERHRMRQGQAWKC